MIRGSCPAPLELWFDEVVDCFGGCYGAGFGLERAEKGEINGKLLVVVGF